MSGNRNTDERINWYDRYYEAGLARGRKEGAAENKNLTSWNIPDALPKHEEAIIIVHRPYDRRTERVCRKRGVSWLVDCGMYLSAKFIKEILPDEYELSSDVDDNGGWVMISKQKAITWDRILLWASVEIPEWFIESNKKGSCDELDG